MWLFLFHLFMQNTPYLVCKYAISLDKIAFFCIIDKTPLKGVCKCSATLFYKAATRIHKTSHMANGCSRAITFGNTGCLIFPKER